MNTIVHEESSPENLIFTYGDSETLIDGECINYFCRKCESCIGKDNVPDINDKLIQHIIEKHL